MPPFRARPAAIDAYEWPGGPVAADAPHWIRDALVKGDAWYFRPAHANVELVVRSAEGAVSAKPSWWIICDDAGRLSALPPKDFHERFEPA